MTELARITDPTFMSYADFGRRFFEVAITRDRVVQAVGDLAGRPIEVGPMSVGPIGLVKVRAQGEVGRPTVERRDGEHITFELTIPVDLQLRIEIGLDKYRFTADVKVRLPIVARAAEPLLVVIDVRPPSRRNIDVDLKADGLRASVLQVVGGIENEIRKTVASFVRKEIEKPEMVRARTIDVAHTLAALGRPEGES